MSWLVERLKTIVDPVDKESDMNFKSASAAVVVLAVTTVLAQGTSTATQPASTPAPVPRRMPLNRLGALAAGENKAAASQGPAALKQRLQDLEATVTSMHTLLAQMHEKAGAAKSRDPLAKANLDMWDLMVAHLDKEVQELKLAVAAREDLDARRAAMYRQADLKAQAAARAAQAAQQMRFGMTAAPGPQAAQPGASGQATASPAATGQTPASPK